MKLNIESKCKENMKYRKKKFLSRLVFRIRDGIFQLRGRGCV